MTNSNRFLNASEVRELLGGVSDMSIRRWQRDRGFPPHAKCGRLRLWSEAEVLIWVEAQRQATPAMPPTNPHEIKPGSEMARKAGDALGRAE